MLTGKLIGLAKACQTKPKTDNTDRIILYILTELGHADFLADDNEKIKLYFFNKNKVSSLHQY